MPVSILTWKPLKHGFRARTKQHTLNVRAADQLHCTWLWTVHRRGGVPGGRRLEAHGREDDSEKAMRAAEEAVFGWPLAQPAKPVCECAEAGTRNCGIHQNEQDAAQIAVAYLPEIQMKTGPQKPLKVYLCGAHCVGKSTLARWISRKFQLPHIAEVARTELAKLEITFDQLRVDVDLTSTYQRNVFAAQLEAERGRNRFVADRAFLDNLAYLGKHARGLHDVLKSPACRQAADEMRAGVRQGTTLVFFVRPHVQLLRGDGFRAESDLDVAGVWAIDGAVQFMLEMWDIDYIPIESFSFKERQRTVEALLRGK